jgi:MFS family permease
VYLATTRSGKPGVADRARVPLRSAMTATVLALGTVSLLTDVSTEMVTAILPAYVVLDLHLSVVQYGMVDGLYVGVTALTRLLGGWSADRLRARKAVAGAGYGLGVLAKLGLLGASGAGGIGAALAADRIGKGLRTAPRDALITLSAPSAALGRAFGVHRAMDACGAFLGPLVAIAVLAAANEAFDAVFVVSMCVALLGLAVLLLFVRDDRGDRAAARAAGFRQALGLVRRKDFRHVLYAGMLLGLVTVGDGLVYLLLQRWQNLPVLWFPLFAVLQNLGYLVLATPLGWLADRVGRRRVVLGGHVALVAVYVLLATQSGGWPAVALTLVLYGAFYAATDGVLMATAGPLLPEALRTAGLSVLQTGQAVAYAVSSVLFGLGWALLGPGTVTWVAAAGVVVALPGAALWLRGKP